MQIKNAQRLQSGIHWIFIIYGVGNKNPSKILYILHIPLQVQFARLCHILAYPTYHLPTPCSSRFPPNHAQRRAGLFGNTHNVGKLSKIIRQGYVGQQTDEWKIYQGQEIPENWYLTPTENITGKSVRNGKLNRFTTLLCPAMLVNCTCTTYYIASNILKPE